ncbi:hypothetical protein V0M98_33500 (plasmid) [Pseudomonas silesiensis]|uniref:hypothetical protein n=1 Tax=Pseudomonas silesiensis TaxID=1853130 RepID=UPI0030CB9225
MKTDCTEKTKVSGLVTLDYSIPEQESVDAGEKPRFVIDVLPLLVAQEKGDLPKNCFGSFEVDAESVFLDEARDVEQAETVAQWLEIMAENIRAKFKPV